MDGTDKSTLLLEIVSKKKTNLCFSADLTKCQDVLDIVDKVGPYICLLKTHVDILTDFDDNFITAIKKLAEAHCFMIFEDRKFADLGNTVKKQFSEGIYKISHWADFINAHIIPGDGIISGLESVAKDQSLILIAQMSAAGNLCTSEYQQQAVRMAKENPKFVCGFICTERMTQDKRFLNFVPGVHLMESGDSFGQQYTTPEQAVSQGADIIIVGRGIYNAKDPIKAAVQYRDASFKPYEEHLLKKGFS